MQPLQYDLRSPAAKDDSITRAAKRGSNTCTSIYIAGTTLQLLSTIEFHRQLIHQHHLQSLLHCGKDHTVANHHGNSIGNSSSSTTCNPIYIAEKILQMQITMRFQRQLIQQHHLQSHLHCRNDPTVANHNGNLSTAHARNAVETPFTMRNRSETNPSMIRPHPRPSRTRRTAEVDHRRLGTHFVWKNIRFRASAISQKRISCETSFKTSSATHPAAPLAIPFPLREGS